MPVDNDDVNDVNDVGNSGAISGSSRDIRTTHTEAAVTHDASHVVHAYDDNDAVDDVSSDSSEDQVESSPWA